MTLRIFDALPPYFGGKRRLVGAIFRHIPPPSEAPVFADAFLGGGSVALYAKARGYAVRCNDLAERSVLVGRALIANDRVTLTAEDVLRLFAPAHDAGRLARDRLAPGVITARHAEFLDVAMAHARRVDGIKGDLLRLLLVQYLYRQRPMGNFGARSITEQVDDGDWDAVNATFLRGNWLDRVHGHPRANCDALRDRINRGVFAGAQPCEVHQGDAAEFLARVEADVAYLDPPYAGTLAYETALRPVDELLAGHAIEPERSRHSSPDWRDALLRLFDAARHIPRWVLSFNNAATSLDELVGLMRRFKPRVEAEAIAYDHCASLANATTRERNREFLIIGSD
ncbi:MAG: DNA adenine methylase [Myxococcales bacterium]|nr:DNA adenine methylase [Myxococcales bacterium]